jgi:hypothetical protein
MAQATQEKAQELAGQAQDKAQEAAQQARGKAQQLVDERSTQAGEQIATQASDLRSVGEQLREQGKEGPAKVADQVAERAERLGGYLKDNDADRLLNDLEDLGRKNPWAVALGGLALGFAASRFLKASSQKRYDQQGSLSQLPERTSPGPSYSTDAGYVPTPGDVAPNGGLGATPVAP